MSMYETRSEPWSMPLLSQPQARDQVYPTNLPNQSRFDKRGTLLKTDWGRMTYAVTKLLFVLLQSEAGSCVLGALHVHKDLGEHAPVSLDNAIMT
eukprot:2096986-Rhodomonas_salina.1